MSFLEIRDVQKNFAAVRVLNSVSLDVEQHQIICLIGSSGCGKSTLLRCINGLEPISGGEIRLQGQRVSGPGVDLNALRRNVGIVFQSYNLFPHMTVLQNIMLAPLKVLGLARSEAQDRAFQLLARIGLEAEASNTLTVSLVGSSSASPLRAPSPWTRRHCCSTRSPPPLTPN